VTRAKAADEPVGRPDAGAGGAPPDDGVRAGNAVAQAAERQGWFIGHFVEPRDDPRATGAVEVKWGVHPAGEARPTWAANARATTMSLLVRGRFRLRFPTRDHLLAREGDYVVWPPGVPHHWVAEVESVVLTVRWPSLPGDSASVDRPRDAQDGG
jgi:hypothetical protein